MRLLLLLSAILAALTGVGGTRAPAQGVQASAVSTVASAPATTSAIVHRAATRYRARAESPRPLPAGILVARSVPIYADCLRE